VTTSYAVFLKPRAERDLDRLPVAVARRIWQRLMALEEEPRPPTVAKLEGSDAYRVRVGNYRVVYLVDDRLRKVEIIRVAHRREVYR
jgi:mRNA interferase RelE/StbE